MYGSNGNGHGQVFDWSALKEFVPPAELHTNGNGLVDATRVANWETIFAREDQRRLDENKEVFGSGPLMTRQEYLPTREHNYEPNPYKDHRSKFAGALCVGITFFTFGTLPFVAATAGANESTQNVRCNPKPPKKCIEYVEGYEQRMGRLSILQGVGGAVALASGSFIVSSSISMASHRRRQRQA